MRRCKKSSTQIFQHKNELISSRHHQHHRIDLPLRILHLVPSLRSWTIRFRCVDWHHHHCLRHWEAPRSDRNNHLAVISSRRRCHRGTILVPCLVSPPCCRSTCNLFARLHRALPTRRYPQEHIVHLSRQYLTANNSHQRYFKGETSSESIDTLSARQYIFWLMFQQHHHS